MEVTFASIRLTGETPIEWASPITPMVTPVIDEVPLIRAAEPFIEARGNQLEVVRFGCWRRYSSHLLARQAQRNFIKDLPLKGELVFELTASGYILTERGTGYRRPSPAAPQLIGRMVRFEFEFSVRGNVSTLDYANVLRDSGGNVVFDSNGQPIIVNP